MGYHSPLCYGMSGAQTTLAAPADSTTYYFGNNIALAPTTNPAYCRVYIPFSGRIIAGTLFSYVSVTGTNEAVVLYIRINNTTDYSFGSLDLSQAQTGIVNSTLDIPVTAGDYLEFKMVTPAWVSDPTNFRPSWNLVIEMQR